MSIASRVWGLGLCCCLAVVLPGCGGGGINEGDVPASGTVTFDGNPLKTGSIALIAADGSTTATGIINEGKFEIRQTASYAGVAPGTYKVTVNSWIREPGSVSPEGEIIAEGERAIPEKFSNPEQSELTLTVPEKGSKALALELKSQ